MRVITIKIKLVSIVFIVISVMLALPFAVAPCLAAEVKVPDYQDSILLDEDDSRLSFPTFVYAEPVTGEIYVGQKGDLVIYSPLLFPLFTFGKRQGINVAFSIAVDDKGNSYVATGGVIDQPVPKISVFNTAFRRTKDIFFPAGEKGEPYRPNRLAIDNAGNLYVLSAYDTKVLVCDLSGRQHDVMSVQEEGEPAPLVDIQIDSKGRIYLVNERDSKIYVFNEQRKFLFKFGEKGGSSAKLSRPISVAVDAELGLIYVDDYMRHAINIYDYSGQYFSELGGLGYMDGWFHFPSRVAVDREGRLLVADTFNNRVQVFKWKQKPELPAEKAAQQGGAKK